MTIDSRVAVRLAELIEEGDAVLNTRKNRSGYSEALRANVIHMGDDGVDAERSYRWGTSCLNLLSRVFGRGSDHYIRFKQLSTQFEDYTPVQKALGILKAAKDDYEGGFVATPVPELPSTAEDSELRALQAEKAHRELLTSIRAVVAVVVVTSVFAVLVFGLAYGTTWGALDWLRGHLNGFGIILAGCVVLFSMILAIAKKEWRGLAVTAGIVGGILVIAQIAGGPLQGGG